MRQVALLGCFKHARCLLPLRMSSTHVEKTADSSREEVSRLDELAGRAFFN